jgi:hypothetical protein
VIQRDGGCVFRFYPEAGACGSRPTKDGYLILQFDHLNTRARNISFGKSSPRRLCMRAASHLLEAAAFRRVHENRARAHRAGTLGASRPSHREPEGLIRWDYTNSGISKSGSRQNSRAMRRPHEFMCAAVGREQCPPCQAAPARFLVLRSLHQLGRFSGGIC